MKIRDPERPIKVLLIVVKRPGFVGVFLSNFFAKPIMSNIRTTASLAGNPPRVHYVHNGHIIRRTASVSPGYAVSDLTRPYPTTDQVRLRT